jgi:hypothetical protein
MIVHKPAWYNKQTDTRKRKVEQLADQWDTLPIGQRVIRLKYPTYTFDGLKKLFELDKMQSNEIEAVKASLVNKYCADNQITRSVFMERYELAVDMESLPLVGTVAAFSILLQKDIEDKHKKLGDKVREAFEQHAQQVSPEQLQMGQLHSVVVNTEELMDAAPIAQAEIAKFIIALEPLAVYCRDEIPMYVFKQMAIATNVVGLNEFFIAFVTDRGSLSIYSPRIVLASLGRHYLVEVASWR